MDLDATRVSVIVPAYNEAASIVATLGEMKSYFEERRRGYELIVSADGTDGTRERAREWAGDDRRVKVIGGDARRGKGFGIRRAMELVQGELVGFVDADNKTPITEFDKFVGPFAGGVDIAIGSRSIRGAQIEKRQPWYRRAGSMGFGVFMHAVVGLRDIRDTQCGFKFFKREVGRDLFNRQKIDGYMFDAEILYLAKRSGYRIVQVPVRWRDDADSRLELFRGNLVNVQDIFRIRRLHRSSQAEDKAIIL